MWRHLHLNKWHCISMNLYEESSTVSPRHAARGHKMPSNAQIATITFADKDCHAIIQECRSEICMHRVGRTMGPEPAPVEC